MVIFTDNNEVWRKFCDECDVGTMTSVIVATNKTFSKILNTSNTT